MNLDLEINVACDVVSITAESPVWSSRDKSLYWVDVRSNCIHRLTSSGVKSSWDVGERISSIGFRKDGGLIGTLRSGIYSLDISNCGTQIAKNLIVSPDLPAGARPKEGKADACGFWWFGSTCDENKPIGGYYRLSPDARYTCISRDVIMANGLAVNSQGNKVMAADSISNTIWSWDIDVQNNIVSNKEIFAHDLSTDGLIDGATFDDQGYYWCALFGAWSIARFAPSGKLDKLIRVPVKYPTMCAFGGENLDSLFVTSSKFHAINDEEEQLLAGCLFKIDGIGIRGVKEHEFG